MPTIFKLKVTEFYYEELFKRKNPLMIILILTH